MVDLSKINEINDEEQLQKMLSATQDLDERKVIRNRLIEVKAQKSKERDALLKEREKRREEEINERKKQKEEDKKLEIKRLEDLAKSGSSGERFNNEMSKQREECLKEKIKAADEEKKKEIQKFEQMAKSHASANEKGDSAIQQSIQQKAAWAAEDKKQSLKNLDSVSKTKTAAATKPQPKGAQAAFEMFQSKDKEAGGTGKASATAVAASSVNNPNSIKDNLLRWCQIKTQGYPNVSINNFSSSWADGMAFCALIHKFVPHTFDFSKLNPKNRRGNFNLAFKVAEKEADIAPLLDVEDMILMGDKPDYKCVFTYVQSFYRKFELEPRAKAAASSTTIDPTV